jgi:hypothetical protein
VQEHTGAASLLDESTASGPTRQDMGTGRGVVSDTPELTETMTARLRHARLNPVVRSDTSTAAERIVRELKAKPEPERLEQLAQKSLSHFAKAGGAGKAEMRAHQAVLESAQNGWEQLVRDGQSTAGGQTSETEATVFSELMAHFANTSGTDPMTALFATMKDSVEEMNRDKKYALEKLQSMNEIAEAMGDYLSELADQSEELQASTGEETSGDKVDVNVRLPQLPGPEDDPQITRLGPKQRVAMSPIERDAHIGHITRLKDELDSQKNMMQLELRDSTDRLQRNQQTISNVLKALTDTGRTLLQNMK